MAKRRAIAWAVGRALVCGVLLTFAAARVDDVRVMCGGKLALVSESAPHESGRLLRGRDTCSDTVLFTHYRDAPTPSIRLLAAQVRTADWQDLYLKIAEYDRERPNELIIQNSQGWPLRAFAARWVEGKQIGGVMWIRGPISMNICMHPLWFGLVVDVLFFACVVGAVDMGLRSAWRWKRRRAGKCASCGYSRAGLAQEQVCPECGAKA